MARDVAGSHELPRRQVRGSEIVHGHCANAGEEEEGVERAGRGARLPPQAGALTDVVECEAVCLDLVGRAVLGCDDHLEVGGARPVAPVHGAVNDLPPEQPNHDGVLRVRLTVAPPARVAADVEVRQPHVQIHAAILVRASAVVVVVDARLGRDDLASTVQQRAVERRAQRWGRREDGGAARRSVVRQAVRAEAMQTLLCGGMQHMVRARPGMRQGVAATLHGRTQIAPTIPVESLQTEIRDRGHH